MADPITLAAPIRPLHFKGGPHGVLLFHGLSSSPLELQFLARGLHRAGYTVHVPVIEHYTYGLKSTGVASVQGWMQAASQQFDLLQRECETVSVGGLCLGAVMALRLSALRQGEVAATLAMSTALHFDGWANPWYTPFLPLGRYLPFAGRIGVEEKSPFGLKDERMRAWVERQMKENRNSEAGAAVLRVADLLRARELIKATRRSLNQVASPVLLLHAEEDECASPRSAREVASSVLSRDVRLVLLRDSYHMISMDREKELVLGEMTRFLEDRLARDESVSQAA